MAQFDVVHISMVTHLTKHTLDRTCTEYEWAFYDWVFIIDHHSNEITWDGLETETRSWDITTLLLFIMLRLIDSCFWFKKGLLLYARVKFWAMQTGAHSHFLQELWQNSKKAGYNTGLKKKVPLIRKPHF